MESLERCSRTVPPDILDRCPPGPGSRAPEGPASGPTVDAGDRSETERGRSRERCAGGAPPPAGRESTALRDAGAPSMRVPGRRRPTGIAAWIRMPDPAL